MKFTEILENLKKGEKVTREKWGEPDCTIDFIVYDQNKGNFLLFYKGNCYRFNFNDEDIVAEDWKIYEEKPTQVWKPNVGDKYYYISNTGSILYYMYDEDVTNKAIISIGNCFETREEAEHMLEKIRIINQLRKMSNIDFYDCETKKYALYYSPRYKSVSIQEHNCVKELPFSVYFATQKDCENAIKAIGEWDLKKYYFDIKDNQ